MLSNTPLNTATATTAPPTGSNFGPKPSTDTDPDAHTYQISSKSVQPFRRSSVTKPITEEFYI